MSIMKGQQEMMAHCLQYDSLGLSNEAAGNQEETKDISLWKHSMACRHKQTLPIVRVKHWNRQPRDVM